MQDMNIKYRVTKKLLRCLPKLAALWQLKKSVHTPLVFIEFQFYSIFLRKNWTETNSGLQLALTSYLLNSEITFKDKIPVLVFLLNSKLCGVFPTYPLSCLQAASITATKKVYLMSKETTLTSLPMKGNKGDFISILFHQLWNQQMDLTLFYHKIKYI